MSEFSAAQNCKLLGYGSALVKVAEMLNKSECLQIQRCFVGQKLENFIKRVKSGFLDFHLTTLF